MSDYKFRNLPCTAGAWYVEGTNLLGGSGVLEWCVSEKDALEVMGRMHRDRRFTNLRVGKDDASTA